jgi:diadenosine tetraphosphate (Ap4A) HIT family hydrolase
VNVRATCLLCDAPLTAGEAVYEDALVLVLLHPDWSPRGHAMVVVRRHVENASELPEDEWLHVAGVWQRTERALLDLTGADRAVMLKLGILTPHLHLHIYPVAAGDSREEVFAAFDGKRGAPRDPEFVAELRARLTGGAR